MTGSAYDDDAFFAAYRLLDRSVRGLDGAPEWPAVRDLLPDLQGARVVDLGCGFGAFARWAAGAGAIDVLAVDGSSRMLEQARADTDVAAVRFQHVDVEHVVLPTAAFDLVYSALVVHYLADLDRFVRTAHDALRPGGRFVLTTEHPVFMASTRADFVDIDGVRTWPVDHYADEGERVRTWLGTGVRKWFRSLGTIVNALVDAGFVVRRLVEWTPSAEQVAETPLLAAERDRPAFALLAADRLGS